MPQHENDQQLADNFIDFFIRKIEAVRKELDMFPIYQLETNINLCFKFNNFEALTEEACKETYHEGKGNNLPYWSSAIKIG